MESTKTVTALFPKDMGHKTDGSVALTRLPFSVEKLIWLLEFL